MKYDLSKDELELDQKFWMVCAKSGRKFIECPVCDDDKKITIKGHEFSCPHCKGYGTIEKEFPKEIVVKECVVYGIETHTYSKVTNPLNYTDSITYHYCTPDGERSYFHHISKVDLFTTFEEAEAFKKELEFVGDSK